MRNKSLYTLKDLSKFSLSLAVPGRDLAMRPRRKDTTRQARGGMEPPRPGRVSSSLIRKTKKTLIIARAKENEVRDREDRIDRVEKTGEVKNAERSGAEPSFFLLYIFLYIFL